MLALVMAKEKGTMSRESYEEIVKELLLIPERMQKMLEVDKQIEPLSKEFTFAHHFIYMGRGFGYPVALEGALKLKEISYIHVGCSIYCSLYISKKLSPHIAHNKGKV